jgi:hypothetical protein
LYVSFSQSGSPCSRPGFGRTTGFIAAAAVVLLVLGVFLSFKGYSRD